LAYRDLASRIYVRNAPKAGKAEPTRMTRRGHAWHLQKRGWAVKRFALVTIVGARGGGSWRPINFSIARSAFVEKAQ
jgi:hypothetical protein